VRDTPRMPDGAPELPPDPRDFYVVTPKVTVAEVASLYQRAFPERRGLSRKNLERRCTLEAWPKRRHAHEDLASEKLSKTVAQSHARTRARHVTQYRYVGRVSMRLVKGLEASLDLASAAVVIPPGTSPELEGLLRRAKSVDSLRREDLDALRAAATAIDTASKGERELVGEKDDRITKLLDAAGELADAEPGVIEYDPEAELERLVNPTVDLPQQGKPVVAEVVT